MLSWMSNDFPTSFTFPAQKPAQLLTCRTIENSTTINCIRLAENLTIENLIVKSRRKSHEMLPLRSKFSVRLSVVEFSMI